MPTRKGGERNVACLVKGFFCWGGPGLAKMGYEAMSAPGEAHNPPVELASSGASNFFEEAQAGTGCLMVLVWLQSSRGDNNFSVTLKEPLIPFLPGCYGWTQSIFDISGTVLGGLNIRGYRNNPKQIRAFCFQSNWNNFGGGRILFQLGLTI